MYLSARAIQESFHAIARENFENKVWGVFIILKNLILKKEIETPLGNLRYAEFDLNAVKNDLHLFFSREPEIFEVETTPKKCSVLFRKDFEQWTTDLLKSKRINATALAIFLFRNESFENEQSAEDLQKRLFSLFQFSEEEKSRWFSASSNIHISFSTTCYKWQDSFTIGNASYSFKSSHKSIVFKPSNDLYSVVASPEELTRGPFYQPLYASSDNALLFNSEKYFLKNSTNSPSTPLASDSPVQIIYYGVPGCGKSNKIDEALKNVPDERKIRTVFHPEYTNADFVGQILPKTDGVKISYEFTPGPFTEILKRARQKPKEHFYLIIEEINRGNAAAIFGDIFQLLDRGENGISQYSIQNKEIAQYINSQDNTIRLPGNLSIIATMNTSDQNVFTLDNAFQRRFDMVLVRSGVTRNTGVNEPSLDPNDYKFEPNDGAIRYQFEAKIEDTEVPWGFFWDWVNSEIECALRGLSSTEDKRLGLWFVKNKNGKIPKKVFAEKVLKYLWDDAFKFKRKEIFSDNIHSLEELISEFEESKNANALSRIFKDFPENGQS